MEGTKGHVDNVFLTRFFNLLIGPNGSTELCALNLSHVYLMDDACWKGIVNVVPKLRWLNLSGCTGLSQSALIECTRLPLNELILECWYLGIPDHWNMPFLKRLKTDQIDLIQ